MTLGLGPKWKTLGRFRIKNVIKEKYLVIKMTERAKSRKVRRRSV